MKLPEKLIEIKLEDQPQDIRIFLPPVDWILLVLGGILVISGIGVWFGNQGPAPTLSLIGIGLALLGYVGINALKFASSVSKNRAILFDPVRNAVMEERQIKLTSSQIALMWCHEQVFTPQHRMRFEYRQGPNFKVGIYPAPVKEK
jgi:hypothetical protein